MLINPEDAVRMLRDNWSGDNGAMQLSQELYAIFTSAGPAQSTGPATFSNPGTQAPISIEVPSLTSSVPAIAFTGPQGQPAGGITIQDGVPVVTNAAGQPTTQAVGGSASGGNAAGGTVVSGGPGSGPYVVQLRVGGKNVSATVIQIDSSQTIPAGSAVIVVKESNGSYSIQPPVWM